MNHILRWVGAIFAGVGAVLLIAAVVLLYRDSAFAHRAARADARVAAQARDPATGRLRRFESDALWVDPTEALDGQTIRVLIDPADARSYYMDVAPIINVAQ